MSDCRRHRNEPAYTPRSNCSPSEFSCTRQPRAICDENATSSCIADSWRKASLLWFLRAPPWPTLLRCRRREASLEEIVSDPIVRAVMEADAVSPAELEAMLRRGGERVCGRPRGGGEP